MQKLSDRFKASLALATVPRWKLSLMVSIEPSVLNKLVTGQRPISKTYESRLVEIGQVLGLKPEECFTETNRASERKRLAKELGLRDVPAFYEKGSSMKAWARERKAG